MQLIASHASQCRPGGHKPILLIIVYFLELVTCLPSTMEYGSQNRWNVPSFKHKITYFVLICILGFNYVFNTFATLLTL